MTVSAFGLPRREVESEPELELCLEAIEVEERTAPAGIEGKDGERLREVMELRAKELIEDAKEALRVMLELRVIEERRLVNGEGASSSSLNKELTSVIQMKYEGKTYESLQPRPVVRPTPSLKSLPSRWRLFLFSVFRLSLGTLRPLGMYEARGSASGVGGRRTLEYGDNRPA